VLTPAVGVYNVTDNFLHSSPSTMLSLHNVASELFRLPLMCELHNVQHTRKNYFNSGQSRNGVFSAEHPLLIIP
jgi:hypothetical protein